MSDSDRPRADAEVLDSFSEIGRAWFRASFANPTPAQTGAWREIASGRNVLVVAPTGSGKTLAAFFWALDELMRAANTQEKGRCTVLYVSPLKALAADVERNLNSPLIGMAREAARIGLAVPEVTVGLRTGDTTVDQRRRLVRTPPDILITTPESLFLLLTSQARESLRHVGTVIIDEIHAVADSKRGAHLAVSLERLDELLDKPMQRIGLSATVQPLDNVARFLGGAHPVAVVAPPSEKRIEVSVSVPVADMSQPVSDLADPHATVASAPQERSSVWPHVERSIVDLIGQHASTLVFVNSRRLAERVTARINEIHDEGRASCADEQDQPVTPKPPGLRPPPAAALGASGTSKPIDSSLTLARAHHGSVSKQQRTIIESELKAGRLKAVVATSSLELGIDMGALDLVIQVEAPPSVASGLQRVGRAGHSVDQPSRGVIFPKHRADLLATAVIAERMRRRELEPTRMPSNPLDVLAQQIVAAVSMDDWPVSDLFRLVRRAAPYRTLPESAFTAVLDMLAGRYPSDAFAELRARVIWDRASDVLRTRPGAQRLAVTSGGTIPDRGLFPVFVIGDRGTRIGELDEEMVYESRVGDCFALGASSWRIEEITHDRVQVSPAPGAPGRLPFWHGDSIGRPATLGAAIGRFTREVAKSSDSDVAALLAKQGLDQFAVDNLIRYIRDQQAATGRVADDRTIIVERFRDEVGDWRVAIHSPFGARVHAPWALAISAAITDATGFDTQAMHADDGIILRLPDTEDGQILDDATAALRLDPDDIVDRVTHLVGSSALFASRFRECAARSLLLPRRDPGKRTPLWQQRQRSAALLAVAARYPSFPVVIEAVRECLQDVYDLPGLIEVLTKIRSGEIDVVEVTTPMPSPYARSLLFGYVAAYLYEGDSPLAERRAAALTLDSELLGELLGYTELRELLDPDSIAAVEMEVACLSQRRHAKSVEGFADLLRLLGPMPVTEWRQRGVETNWIEELLAQRRAMSIRINGRDCVAAVEDASRLRDGLGCPLPVGIPEAFLAPVADPLGDLISRYARTHGPFTDRAVGEHFGLAPAVVDSLLDRLAASGHLVRGEFRPTAVGTEWCDVDVLRRIRRRSIAVLRQELEPVPTPALGVFLPQWQGVASGWRGADGVLRAIDQLAGCQLPLSAFESSILPNRVSDYQPAMLDELCTAGEVVWCGVGTLSGGDGWISVAPADLASDLLPLPVEPTPHASGRVDEQTILDLLSAGGAWTHGELLSRMPGLTSDELSQMIWELTWAGLLTADTFAPLRERLAARGKRMRARTPMRMRSGLRSRSRMARFAVGGGELRANAPLAIRGRWSIVPARSSSQTARLANQAAAILERHGIVTRGTINIERFEGGFAAAYRVLTMMEDSGSARRGYIVEGLGGAQFALPGAVDLIRNIAAREDGLGDSDRRRTGSGNVLEPSNTRTGAIVLAATDPANPYGAALPWPNTTAEAALSNVPPTAAAVAGSAAEPAEAGPVPCAPSPMRSSEAPGHRPGRKAGATVVLVDGHLAAYLERGGRSLLTFQQPRNGPGPGDDHLRLALEALARASSAGSVARIRLERIDGQPATVTTIAAELMAAGFHSTPHGWRLAR